MARDWLNTLYGRLPIPAQQALVAAKGWKSYRDRFGAPFRRTLREIEATDRLDADGVREDQERRLRETVRWAARTVPFYRERFRRDGIDPASIRKLDDLPRLPTLSKEEVRAAGTALRSEAVSPRDIIPGRTSGTSGTAIALYHTREALGWEYAVNWRQRRWFGCDLKERFGCFGGQTVVPFAQEERPFWRYDLQRARMLFSLYHMTPRNLAAYAEELQRPGYHFWQGYPSSIALVCQYLIDAGITLGNAAPRAVFTSSETLLDFHRERIVQATGAPVADRYGNAEFAVSVLQCPEGRYHVDTEFGVVEIDPHEETEEWVRGEVVATGFANRAMPFLRYRTGDVATLRRSGSCPCGRARPIVEEIDGRIEHYVVTPDGRRIGRMDHVFKDAHEVKEAQIVQRTPERIAVRLVPRPGFDARAQRELETAFRTRLGDQIEVAYEEVETIERDPNGKFRLVVSELDLGALR